MEQLISVRSLFKETDAYAGKQIKVGGWVRNLRASKNFGFINLSDGTFFSQVQVVYGSELANFTEISKLNIGAAVIVTGTLVLTPDAKQPFELQASEVFVEGPSTPDYPIQPKRHSMEYLRTVTHLRPRTNTFQAVFRVRSLIAYAIHKFFQDIVGRIGALLLEKFVQLGFILELMGAVCPHAVIWLGNNGPADSFGESLGLRYICRHTPAGGGDTGFLVVGFHHGFALKLFDLSGFNAGGDIKICPQAGILFQPIFIVAFYPVDLAILESEKAHGAQHFIIVFHVVHTVILGQCAFEQGGQRFVRGIANAKHIYAIGTQAVTKIPVIFREMR